MRVLHLTDPHLFAEDTGELRGVVTDQSLKRVIAHYQEGDWRADVVAATGDLIQDDSIEAYERFCAHLAPLGLPVYTVPGNHDVPALMQQVLSAEPFHVNANLEVADWLIVGLDSTVAGHAGGVVETGELERLDAAIEASEATNVIVCLHHPPVAMGSRWLDSVGMKDGEAVLEWFGRSGRVRCVLFGHVHQAYDQIHDGIRLIATPSTCRQFAPGSDDFAVDDRPPAYRRIELGPSGALQTEIQWL